MSLQAPQTAWIFAPDGILINKSGPLEIYPYSKLNASTEFVCFVWTGMAVSAKDPLRDEKDLPEDALVIGQTWQYVNLDGGPDRRFNDNYEIPVILAGVLTLDIPDRDSLSLQISNWYLPLEFSDYWTSSKGTNLTKDAIDVLKPIFQRIFPSDFLTEKRSNKPVKDCGKLARAGFEEELKVPKKPSTTIQSVTTKNTSRSEVMNASKTMTGDQPIQTGRDVTETKEAVRLNPELPRPSIFRSKGFWIGFSLVLGLFIFFGIVSRWMDSDSATATIEPALGNLRVSDEISPEHAFYINTGPKKRINFVSSMK